MNSQPRDVKRTVKRFEQHYNAMRSSRFSYFQHSLERFITFLERDDVMQSILKPLLAESKPSVLEDWWNEQSRRRNFKHRQWTFPGDPMEEFTVRFNLIRNQARGEGGQLVNSMNYHSSSGRRANEEFFFVSIVEPFCQELTALLTRALSDRAEAAASAPPMVSKELAAKHETRIFLSHKSDDKPLVKRYKNALVALGFSPWLDESEIRTGDEVDRKIKRAMRESCAAVFFLTENFKDETYLSDEINYAKQELRNKGNHFKIITLRFSNHAEIPDLLDTYRYEAVENDLDGLFHIIRALPIELGPVRWKDDVTE